MKEATVQTTFGEWRLALDRGRFWMLVADTLTVVFHAEGGKETAWSYRREMEEEASPGERLLVYHASPLQIAADLAGIDREISDDERRCYLELERKSIRDGTTEAA